jgi:hypothetical protein
VPGQIALRGMAALACGLQYDAYNRLVSLESEAAQGLPGCGRCLRPDGFWAC